MAYVEAETNNTSETGGILILVEHTTFGLTDCIAYVSDVPAITHR